MNFISCTIPSCIFSCTRPLFISFCLLLLHLFPFLHSSFNHFFSCTLPSCISCRAFLLHSFLFVHSSFIHFFSCTPLSFISFRALLLHSFIFLHFSFMHFFSCTLSFISFRTFFFHAFLSVHCSFMHFFSFTPPSFIFIRALFIYIYMHLFSCTLPSCISFYIFSPNFHFHFSSMCLFAQKYCDFIGYLSRILTFIVRTSFSAKIIQIIHNSMSLMTVHNPLIYLFITRASLWFQSLGYDFQLIWL